MICLTLSGPTILDNLKALADNKDYVDICELRLDLLSSSEVPKAADFPSMVDIPVILTLPLSLRLSAAGCSSELPPRQRERYRSHQR